ncbi:hypothetical protein AAFF_G00141750 [Aldrovandia affinis]|uniref:Uncharacterized protein n=1 Tax=Aldrovandia affinis TaxID=143900 RepID=A0AAD7X294_9TELE|nr:hypothetical protein AAFF_G00141750 [Aldrovandia affinis]
MTRFQSRPPCPDSGACHFAVAAVTAPVTMALIPPYLRPFVTSLVSLTSPRHAGVSPRFSGAAPLALRHPSQHSVIPVPQPLCFCRPPGFLTAIPRKREVTGSPAHSAQAAERSGRASAAGVGIVVK